jgi:hypothetical protein
MYPPNVNLVSDYRIRESGYCLNVSFIIIDLDLVRWIALTINTHKNMSKTDMLVT